MNIDELRERIKQLPALPDCQPGHSWLWRCTDLRDKILHDNPENFLTWPVVRGAMFVGNAPYIPTEAKELSQRYFPAINESLFGGPEQYNHLGYITSGNLIHQAYHLMQWEQRTKKRIESLDTILEFGGGYGTMAMIAKRLGFKGRYIIYDLPEFSALQEYYLSNVGVKDVEFWTEFGDVKDIDLLIGLYSLTEVEPDFRERFIFVYPAQSYLFAYAANWDGWDNIAWAHNLMAYPGYDWHNWKVHHAGVLWYLVGHKQ